MDWSSRVVPEEGDYLLFRGVEGDRWNGYETPHGLGYNMIHSSMMRIIVESDALH